MPNTMQVSTIIAIPESGAPVYVSDLEIDGNDCLSVGLEGENIGVFLDEMLESCLQNPKLNNRDWLMERAAKRAEKAAKEETRE